MRGILPLLFGAVLAAATPADEIATTDGKSQQGKLELDPKGHLCFRVAGSSSPLALGESQQIRLTPTAPAWRSASVHRVALPQGQRLTGEVLELNNKHLRVRMPWSEQLVIPRSAIQSIIHPPGQVVVLDEDFEQGLKSWQSTGNATLSDQRHVSAKHSLRLNAPGQSVERVLGEVLEAGRLTVQFHDPGDVSGARWLVEAEFQRAQGPWTVRIAVACDRANYEGEAPGCVSKALARSKGWHQLDLRFTRDYLLVGVDNQLLCESIKQGPGGPLCKLRLSCVPTEAGARAAGEVCWDDLILFRTVEDRPHQCLDVTQDEVWQLAGDQFLGQIERAGRQGFTLQGPTEPLTFAWSQVRGVFLKRQTVSPRTTEGEQVLVWLHSAAGGEPDWLEGVILALDERRLLLKHPVLGELTIPRPWLREVRRLFHGQRVELDNGFHHLGDRTRLVSELQPARAEGTALRLNFRLETAPTETRLLVRAVHLKGPGDGIGPALERGEQRTEVIVNGQRVDYLNRHVGRSSPEAVPIRITVPRRCLQVGENVLELRQTPDLVSEKCPSCGIAGVALELPR